MSVIIKRLTNKAYGYPRGAARRVEPVALACVHITGNINTSRDPDPRGAVLDEWSYANRAGSDGPSAHLYIARDGWAIEAIAPVRYVAWSNGDVSSPNTSNPGIRRVLALRAKGYNANEAYWEEFENVGFPGSYPITAAQMATMADRLRVRSLVSGLPINRETVHGHWEINGVDRQNCPDSNHEAFLNRLINLATENDDVTPAPITDETPKIVTALDGHTWRDLDGKTLLLGNRPALVERISPYGITAADGDKLRAIYATVGGVRRIVIIDPSTEEDVPEPEAPPVEPATYGVTLDALVLSVGGQSVAIEPVFLGNVELP